jgi:hypothetical protein
MDSLDIDKTVKLKVENSAQTTFRLAQVCGESNNSKFCSPNTQKKREIKTNLYFDYKYTLLIPNLYLCCIGMYY